MYTNYPTYPNYPHHFVQQGWQCPICGSVYSPTTIKCFTCAKSTTVMGTNVTSPLPSQPNFPNNFPQQTICGTPEVKKSD